MLTPYNVFTVRIVDRKTGRHLQECTYASRAKLERDLRRLGFDYDVCSLSWLTKDACAEITRETIYPNGKRGVSDCV